eukprot:13475251-Alexandrium_andersonii.AAC.1
MPDQCSAVGSNGAGDCGSVLGERGSSQEPLRASNPFPEQSSRRCVECEPGGRTCPEPSTERSATVETACGRPASRASRTERRRKRKSLRRSGIWTGEKCA